MYVSLLENNPKIDWIIHLFTEIYWKNFFVQASVLYFWIEQWMYKNLCPYEASILVEEYREK